MTEQADLPHLPRRTLLQAALLGGAASLASKVTGEEKSVGEDRTYYNHATGVRILPGQWRPHYPWEHIAWVSPSWPSQDYVWLDFPEAIFTRQGLLYLSHVNPQVEPVVFPDPPPVQWHKTAGGIAYERKLPNGIRFGGKITGAKHGADLQLYIRNGSGEPLNDITLQTCFFLRAIKEFSTYTGDNKYVHIPGRGWTPFEEARKETVEKGSYHLGWRGGPSIADLPVMATLSSAADRLVACTWGKDTYSLICNPGHPCMHADPAFPDLAPGEDYTIRGKLIFFEGTLEQFGRALRSGELGVSL